MVYVRKLNSEILKLLDFFPSVVIIGARQSGKTTLAKNLIRQIKKESLYLDLELESDVNRLSEPELFFRLNKDKCIVIDEAQRIPELFPILRGIIDQDRKPGRFIILGSANTHVLKLSSESLAGRVSYTELTGFLAEEIPPDYNLTNLWLRGAFPEAFLIEENDVRSIWYNSFVKTIAERDLPLLGLKASPTNVLRFLRMIASSQGGLLNKSNLSNSLGISHVNVNEIIEYLSAVFLIRVLEPYHTNIRKRLTKSPKLYIRDTGLMHFLNGINDMNALMGNQQAGNSWEGFCIEQICGSLGDSFSYYFYRTQDLAECDLVLCKGNKPICCVEIKLSLSPKQSRSFTTVINDLGTNYNYIIIPECASEYKISKNVTVSDLKNFIETLKGFI
jgi:uncharacterized protein